MQAKKETRLPQTNVNLKSQLSYVLDKSQLRFVFLLQQMNFGFVLTGKILHGCRNGGVTSVNGRHRRRL